MASNKIILISIDNLRFDCVGYQPDKRQLAEYNILKYLETPTLDTVAQQSLCFTNCISTSTYTTSAHASVFTGLYPPRHGVRAFFDTRLDPDAPVLAEILRRNGYRTICTTDIPELFEPLGLTRGFDHVVVRNDAEVLRLLDLYRDGNVFLFIHFFDVHEPYLFSECPPTKDYNADYFLLMADLCRTIDQVVTDQRPHSLWQSFCNHINRDINHLFPIYVAGVSKFDQGRFRMFVEALKAVGYWEEALTIIFSDHGEGRCSLFNPNHFNHAGELYDNVLRVPLVIRMPGIIPGLNESLVSLVDIFPTLLNLVGVEWRMERPLDGMVCTKGNRNTAYAEVWAARKGAHLGDAEGGKPFFPFIEINDNSWLLVQRCLRARDKKLVIMGKQEDFLDPQAFEVPEEEYVRALYRKLLARFEDEPGLQHYVEALRRGVKQEVLVREFLNSPEYRSRPRIYLYDLEADPGESNPQPVGNNLLNLVEGYAHLQEIMALEAQAVATELIFSEQETPRVSVVNSLQADKTSLFRNLAEKEERSIAVIWRAFELFGEDTGIAFTGGKDSTVLLHLVRRAFDNRVPFKVVHIDTTVKFPEIYEFRDRLQREWNLDLRIIRNENALKWIQIAQDREECCHHLKTEALKEAIRSLGLEALLTGVRWDEQAARAQEEYFSERQDPPHTRVHPLLHFTEQDVWEYIRKYDIPYCSLYDKGYRSLGCQPCTKPAVTGGAERAGRAQDKEQVMQRLRQLGYF